MTVEVDLIRCRARLGDQPCYDGSPITRQIPDGARMSEDGTWDGETIVCDACYLALQPLTVSGAALYDELPAAILQYQANLEHVRAHPDPGVLAAEAMQTAMSASAASPLGRSAAAAAAMAQREVDRREADA